MNISGHFGILKESRTRFKPGKPIKCHLQPLGSAKVHGVKGAMRGNLQFDEINALIPRLAVQDDINTRASREETNSTSELKPPARVIQDPHKVLSLQQAQSKSFEF